MPVLQISLVGSLLSTCPVPTIKLGELFKSVQVLANRRLCSSSNLAPQGTTSIVSLVDICWLPSTRCHIGVILPHVPSSSVGDFCLQMWHLQCGLTARGASLGS